jgi:hypothetical protein
VRAFSVFLLLFCWVGAFSGLYGLASSGAGRPLIDELARLEKLKNEDRLEPAFKQRLAQLYFLTSRCADLRGLMGQKYCDLCCLCDDGCSTDTTGAAELLALGQLKGALKRPPPALTTNAEFLRVWKKSKHRPEAKFLVLRHLRARLGRLEDGDKKLHQELEEAASRMEGHSP